MDAASKQTAIVLEGTVNTIPTSPGWLQVRDTSVTGRPDRPYGRSPERRSDRRANNMVQQPATYRKVINTIWAPDPARDLILESAFNAAFSTNVLKDASTQRSFSLEEKYEGGSTDPYIRTTGNQVDTLAVNFGIGQAGTIVASCKGRGQSTGTLQLSGATYAAPSPGYDPPTLADLTVNSLFGISSPKVMSFGFTLTNNLYEKYGHGTADPFDIGFGDIDLQVQVQLYFSQLTDYSTFLTKQTAQTLDFTIGSITNYKDRLVFPNCDVWNPDVDDPGKTGSHMVTLVGMAKYYASDTNIAKFTRLVA